MKINKIKDLKLEIERARNEIDFLNSIYDEFNKEEIDNRTDVLRFIIFDSYINIKLEINFSSFFNIFITF